MPIYSESYKKKVIIISVDRLLICRQLWAVSCPSRHPGPWPYNNVALPPIAMSSQSLLFVS